MNEFERGTLGGQTGVVVLAKSPLTELRTLADSDIIGTHLHWSYTLEQVINV
jgi:hypothetical protein